ncbi:MAG: glutamyl-tRNA reductase [Anaerolineae bacterium]
MNKMKFFCVGINHRTAPVELRERVSISHERLQDRFLETTVVNAVAMISTCNRIELYFSADGSAQNQLVSFWSDCCGVDQEIFADSLYSHEDEAAVNHLLRVSAGLESMVLGEPQILGQVTRAYETSIANQTADPLLKSVFKFAIRSGKRARTETKISRNPVSVSSIGVSLVKRHSADLANARILVVGAGEMALLAVKGLKSFGFNHITLVNRNQAKAQELAERWQINAAGLADLPKLLRTADALISATSAPNPIILTSHLNQLNHPVTLVDLAVPRDIDPACGNLPHVQLYDVDALRHEVAEGLAERQKEVPHVESILTEELGRYDEWLNESAVHSTLTAMRQQAEQIRQKELARTLKNLGDTDPAMLKHIEKLSQSLVKQLLHRPTKLLRDEARNGTLNGLEESAKKLFDL